MTAKLVFLATLLAAAPATAAERRFTVDNFQSLHLSGPDDLVLVSGGAPGVVAVGAPSDLDRVSVEVNDGRLEVGRKSNIFRLFDWSKPVTFRVTVPSIHAASVSGSGCLRVDRLRGDAVSAGVSGSGNADIGEIVARNVSLRANGSGGLTAAGRCTSGDLSASGSGGIDAHKLACRDARVSVSGAGWVTASASGEARLSVSGSGSAVVGGKPNQCLVSSSGSGTARCR